MEEQLKKLETEIETIKSRNARVEADKAWEVSRTRAVAIACITFVFTTFALFLIGDEYPIRNAVIATLGFLLSIQSLPFIQKRWIEHRIKPKKTISEKLP